MLIVGLMYSPAYAASIVFREPTPYLSTVQPRSVGYTYKNQDCYQMGSNIIVTAALTPSSGYSSNISVILMESKAGGNWKVVKFYSGTSINEVYPVKNGCKYKAVFTFQTFKNHIIYDNITETVEA